MNRIAETLLNSVSGIFLFFAAIAGRILLERKRKLQAMPQATMRSFAIYTMIPALACARLVQLLAHPARELLLHRWSILFIWQGLDPLGAIAGGTLGGLAWRYLHKTRIVPLADVLVAAIPLPWAIVSFGGLFGETLTVLLPDADLPMPLGNGRIAEMLLPIVFVGIFALLGERRRRTGTYLVVASLLYAPARFCLDFLLTEEVPLGTVTILHLTPKQWGCLSIFVFGAAAATQLNRGAFSQRGRGPSTAGAPGEQSGEYGD